MKTSKTLLENYKSLSFVTRAKITDRINEVSGNKKVSNKKQLVFFTK